MNWLFIGTLLGSIVTSGHDTKEACEGRKFVLQEKGVAGQCHQGALPTGNISIIGSTPLYCYSTGTVGGSCK